MNIQWKNGTTSESRSADGAVKLAEFIEQALKERAQEIIIHRDQTADFPEKKWAIEWGNGTDSRRCHVDCCDPDLILIVSELLKNNPNDVSITAPSSPGGLPEPPYDAIAEALRNGTVVPFLGAGASASARPRGQQWDEKAKFPPTGSELSQFFASVNRYPSESVRDRADLARVASYCSTITPGYLSKRLRGLFYPYSTPGAIHKALAEAFQPLLIVTTNYDALMEDALREKRKPFDVVVHCNRLDIKGSVMYLEHGKKPEYVEPKNFTVPDPLERTLVYKMHGSVDRFSGVEDPPPSVTPPRDERWSNFVITEEDYVDFLSRVPPPIPAGFMKHFASKSFLFLGYGLRDWNFRVVLHNLSAALPVNTARPIFESEKSHWAIQSHPTKADDKLWVARKVTIFDCDLDTFAGELQKPPFCPY
jgi:hypothetical protein